MKTPAILSVMREMLIRKAEKMLRGSQKDFTSDQPAPLAPIFLADDVGGIGVCVYYLLGATQMYLNDWKDSGFEGMISDFAIDSEKLEGAEILVASYSYENYEGSAYVLFRKGEKLYEVHAGHCSCYGLENTWEPEETTQEALQRQLEKGWLGHAEEIQAALPELRAIASTLTAQEQ
jgi:hypothetical protein